MKLSHFTLLTVMIWTSVSIVGVSGPIAGQIKTNETTFENSPTWLRQNDVEKVTQRIQRLLEWDIRRVKVKYYESPTEFQRVHNLDSSVLAVTMKADHSIHLGPRVNSSNFNQVFGHELVHVILFQKYKNAVPSWLDEGLANYLSQLGKVDYPWLKGQPLPTDVRTLSHPFQNSNPRLHYQVSTALIEMIASRCKLLDLLQLSVGKKLESYLSTYCRIQDINQEFNKWVHSK